MDKEYFMNHVRNHEYVKACDGKIGPLQSNQCRPRLTRGVLLAVGDWSTTYSIEAYNSRADNWVNVTAKFEKLRPRGGFGVILVDKNIFVFGGPELNCVRRLNLETFNWSEEPPMRISRHKLSSCLSNGYIYVMGGNTLI